MLQIVSDLLGATINAWILFYAVFKFSNKKINYKSKKFWLCLIGYAIYTIIIYKITTNFLRVIMSYLLMVILNYFILKTAFIKSLLASFCSFFLLFISETLFVVISMFLLRVDLENLKQSYLVSLTSNISAAAIIFILINVMHTKSFVIELFDQIHTKKNKIIIALFPLTILSFSIMLYSIFFELPTTYALFLNVILILIYSILVLNVFSQTNKNEKLQEDYDLKLNELAEYEKTLSEKRKLLHNHDNDLICIRGMIKNPKVNKKAIDYINELLEETKDHDSVVLQKSELIPEGGLQGIIYKKIDIMKNKKINVYLQVDEDINKLNFDKLNSTQNKDICTIIGIFLDNALEASEKAKEKNVSIILTKGKNELIINISNTYKGNIDISRIDEEGYSTKGINRGFGLDIVKRIINDNEYLKNDRQILGNIFNQTLVIKVK